MRTYILVSILSLVAVSTHAGPRNSANYQILTDVADGGGGRATSANYTNDGSSGGVAGISTVAAPDVTAKVGFMGQLYEATGLTLSPGLLTINETASGQLNAWLTLDDETLLAVPATSVTWSVQGGPLTSISTSGLATAGIVYENTLATVQGVYFGFPPAPHNLTVLDSIPDNFGSYSGDGLNDLWQVQYFGLNNSNAGPSLDPDGDGHTNAFEFTAGLVPTSPSSRFTLSPQPVPGQPTRRNIVFSPLVAGRSYVVQSRPSLTSGTWAPLTSFTQSDGGTTRTVTDLNASGPTKFYRVEVTKP